MRKSVLVARAGLAVVLVTTATAFSVPSFADGLAAAGGAGGTTSANASNSGTPPTTSSQGNVSLGAGSQASETSPGQGTASSDAHIVATASAVAGSGSITLALNSGAETGVTSTATNKNAIANALAGGSIGLAQLALSAQAQASSGPGQMTASASASDGSFAIAAKGLVNDLQTSVPGGVTKVIQINSGTESVSCNAAGTCSHASFTSNSVSAGIRIFANTGTVSAGNAEAILRAFLSVEASAGSMTLAASASSNISGSGTSSGHGYSTSVSASLGTWGNSGSWRATSIDGSTVGYGTGTTVGTISARVWVEGEKMCASTQVHLRHSRHAMTTIVKCKHIETNKNMAFRQTTSGNWVTKLFESRRTSRN